jgi:hypothetical protein
MEVTMSSLKIELRRVARKAVPTSRAPGVFVY